jgi:hypothetical protein
VVLVPVLLGLRPSLELVFLFISGFASAALSVSS